MREKLSKLDAFERVSGFLYTSRRTERRGTQEARIRQLESQLRGLDREILGLSSGSDSPTEYNELPDVEDSDFGSEVTVRGPSGQSSVAYKAVQTARDAVVWVPVTRVSEITHSYVRSIGSPGSPPAGLSAPLGVVAHDVFGSPYVMIADTGNSVIQTFAGVRGQGAITSLAFDGPPGMGGRKQNDVTEYEVGFAGHNAGGDETDGFRVRDTANGAWEFTVSGSGSGDGQFATCEDVAHLDGEGWYATDFGNNRVQKFTDAGAFSAKWGTLGSGDANFNGPRGIAVDHAGSLHVVDSGNCRVKVHGANGTFLFEYGIRGQGPGQLAEPVGVDVADSGVVYVTDNYRKVVTLWWYEDGTYLGEFGSGDDKADMQSVHGISCFRDFVYVVDTAASTVHVWRAFSPQTGTLIVSTSGSVIENDTRVMDFRVQDFLVEQFTDEEIAVEARHGLVCILSESMGAISAINVDNIFTTDYRNYKIVLNIDSESAAATLSLNFRDNGSTIATSNFHRFIYTGLTNATTLTGANDSGVGALTLVGGLSGAIAAAIEIDIYDPLNAITTRGFIRTMRVSTLTSVFTHSAGGWAWGPANTFEGFRISIASGNFTGFLTVYGCKEMF